MVGRWVSLHQPPVDHSIRNQEQTEEVQFIFYNLSFSSLNINRMVNVDHQFLDALASLELVMILTDNFREI